MFRSLNFDGRIVFEYWYFNMRLNPKSNPVCVCVDLHIFSQWTLLSEFLACQDQRLRVHHLELHLVFPVACYCVLAICLRPQRWEKHSTAQGTACSCRSLHHHCIYAFFIQALTSERFLQCASGHVLSSRLQLFKAGDPRHLFLFTSVRRPACPVRLVTSGGGSHHPVFL